MKTAMQELIEIYEYYHSFEEFNEWFMDMGKKAMLEKEKEQIMNAYSDGAKGGANGTKGQHESGWVSIQIKEKYYNQTYKPETI